jgi:C1A family cysteine protease
MRLNGNDEVYGVGPFSDLTNEEFNSLHTGWIAPPTTDEEVVFNGTVTADDVDWRSKDAITKVKDQGRCGSCWAFSAVESMESEAFLSKKYKLFELSTQQVTACDKGSNGCNGGNPTTAFADTKKRGGIETEADYPYTAGGGSTGTCKFEASKITVKGFTGSVTLSKGEASMMKGLQERPFSICHDTGGWQNYKSGIMTSCSSGGGHCTQAVGYASSGDYWIIKNSWATKWGNSGYLYLKRGKDLCKISGFMSYPTI